MKHVFVSLFVYLLLLSCNDHSSVKGNGLNIVKDVKAMGNHLSFKINGTLWKADNEIFAAFHPAGYNNAIIIAGSKGPKNKDEQAFNINLYNTAGAGIFHIKNGNADANVIQLANLSTENYMYGSMMGFNVKINITKATSNPTEVEASFEGEMDGNAGDKIQVTEGKFYYHE